MESMIPFEPEPLELMRERFQNALATDYRIRGDVSRPCSPGDVRKQVFDFQHGLRLLVCFVKTRARDVPALFVGAWFVSDEARLSAVMELAKAGQMPVTETKEVHNGPLPGKGLYVRVDASRLIDWIEGHFRALCRWACPLTFTPLDGDQGFFFVGPAKRDYHRMRKKARVRAVPVRA